MRSERAGVQPVRAERRAEQVVGQQPVGLTADGAGQEQPVHHAEEGQLDQQRQAPEQQAAAFALVEGGELALEPVGLAGVAAAQLGDLRLKPGLGGLAAQAVVAEREQQQADGQGERDNGRGGREGAGHRRERAGQRGDEVIRDADASVEESEHGSTLQRVGTTGTAGGGRLERRSPAAARAAPRARGSGRASARGVRGGIQAEVRRPPGPPVRVLLAAGGQRHRDPAAAGTRLTRPSRAGPRHGR